MIVQVKQGKLKGIRNTSVLTGEPFYSFLGIPFAKPPIGNLRFQVSSLLNLLYKFLFRN